jgi:hypothetical protein
MSDGLKFLRDRYARAVHENGFSKLEAFRAFAEKGSGFHFVGTSHTHGYAQLFATYSVGEHYFHFYPTDLENMISEARRPGNQSNAFYGRFIEQAGQALKNIALYAEQAEKISKTYPKISALPSRAASVK